MRRSSIAAILLVTLFHVVAACVGSDPVVITTTPPADAGSPSGLDAAPGADASPLVDASSDAGAAKTTCDPKSAFGSPTRVAGLTDGAFSARLTSDELTIFFAQSVVTSHDSAIFSAHRNDKTQPFGSSEVVFDSNDYDGYPWVTADQKHLVFARTPTPANPSFDLWFASRAEPQGMFSGAGPLTTINTPTYNEYYVFGSSDNGLLFASDRSGKMRIYRAPLEPDDGGVGPAIEFLAIPDGDIVAPVLSSDGRVLYVAAYSGAPYRSNVYVAIRDSTTTPFGTPTAVTELTSTFDEAPTWLSNDLCRLYFTSTRGGPYAVWVASR